MTDAELLAKKLAQIETYVRELRELAHPERMEDDLREQRFVLHTLQLAVQAALDAASHVVSDERLGEPATYRDLFDLLANGGWIAPELAAPLRRMAGFRNLLIHEYAGVDLALVRQILADHLDDLLSFAEALRRRIVTG